MSVKAIRRILAAVKDPHGHELAALGKAAQLARQLQAELVLYHAITEPLYVERDSSSRLPIDLIEKSRTEATRAMLEHVAARLRSLDTRVAISVNWDYPTYEAVIRAARRLEADLVMVDCARASHPARWFLHFTDWELLRHSPVPVLLMKTTEPYRAAPVLAAVDAGHSYGKPEQLDRDILEYGAGLAAALSGPLHAVYAYNPIPALAARELVVPEAVAEAEREAYAQACTLVEPLFETAGVAAENRHVREGFTIDVIDEVAQGVGAQVVVIGAIARSGIKGIVIGNTAERMLDRLSCDLLIVKPADFRGQVPATPRGMHVARPGVRSAPTGFY